MRPRCWYKGCRRRTGFATWSIAGRRYRVCWFHDVDLHFLILEWSGDPDRARKHATYTAQVIRRVNARHEKPTT